MHLELVALIVEDYDRAIEFFVHALGFELIEDSPTLTTNDGRPKRSHDPSATGDLAPVAGFVPMVGTNPAITHRICVRGTLRLVPT